WTGDMGFTDSEGFLTLKDRSKDMIISGGSNIYPRELEEVLLTHPLVLECAVVGREHPEWGEEVVAFVVARPQAHVTPQDLDAVCLDNIARYKRPRQYRFVENLPKNSYGKILKTDLRQLLKETDNAGGGHHRGGLDFLWQARRAWPGKPRRRGRQRCPQESRRGAQRDRRRLSRQFYR